MFKLGAKPFALLAAVSSAFNAVGSNPPTCTRSMSYKVNSPISVPVPPGRCVVINKDVKGCNEGAKFTVASLKKVNDWSKFHEQNSFNKFCYIIRDTKNKALSAACDGGTGPSIYVNYNVDEGLWGKAEIKATNNSHALIRVTYNTTQEL